MGEGEPWWVAAEMGPRGIVRVGIADPEGGTWTWLSGRVESDKENRVGGEAYQGRIFSP